MYQKYHTEALVLGSRQQAEADKVFALFTRDFGLVRARGSSVRAESSKMRYALQNYSRIDISLVKGKRGWRAAGASAIAGSGSDQKAITAFARISELVLRLVHGEEKNDYLFAALSEAHTSLMSAQGGSALGGRQSSDIWPIIEIVCVARVLYALGYISAEALETSLFAHTGYGDPHLSEAEKLHDQLLLSINRAIEETQL